MPEYVVPTPKRRRGRPRGGESGARDRIVAAAVEEFGEFGYDSATMRGIAGRAGVDAALLHHYFGTKADLFAETVGAPMRPDVDIPALLEGPSDVLGERIVRYVLEAWERPETRKRGILLVRAGIGNRLATPLLSEFLQRELFSRIAARLDVPDASLRASLVASQLAGLMIARHVLQLPAVAEASVDELVTRVGPTVQRHEPADRERRRDRDGAPPRPHVRPGRRARAAPVHRAERDRGLDRRHGGTARARGAHSFVLSERAAISTLHARVLIWS